MKQWFELQFPLAVTAVLQEPSVIRALDLFQSDGGQSQSAFLLRFCHFCSLLQLSLICFPQLASDHNTPEQLKY